MMRKWMLVLLLCIGGAVISMAENFSEMLHSKLLADGDKALQEERWDDAATCYWQAAKMGIDREAVDRLGKFHNFWKPNSWYNWDLPARYLAAAADADYRAVNNRKPERYDGNFFIIAKERAIVERLGISELKMKRFWNGADRCRRAVENLYKRLYVDGKNGRVEMRAVDLQGELGTVAVIDFESALKRFDIPEKPVTDWVVYVRSPSDPDKLLPFHDFHRIVYEEKMAAFYELCCKLGASDASVNYLKSDKDHVGVAVQADGRDLASYTSASAAANVAVENQSKEHVKTGMVFNDGKGSGVVRPVSTPWFAKEPTWRAMYAARRDRYNSVTEFTAEFHYTEDYRVNVATKATFENAQYKIAASSQVEFQSFTKIIWQFKVKFPPAETFVQE